VPRKRHEQEVKGITPDAVLLAARSEDRKTCGEHEMSDGKESNGWWNTQSKQLRASHALRASSSWTSMNVIECTIPLKESIYVRTATIILVYL
jgi:hypothetical protein